MTRDAVVPGRSTPLAGPFSPAVRSHGLTYLSGLVAEDPATGVLLSGDIGMQTDRVLRNLSAVLEAAGKTLDDVVRVGVYLTDMSTFSAMNAVYEQHFRVPYPARTTICVAALPLGAAVEMDAVVG
jgi:2-iminobutanoate/2-iminopropanoate deaminase